MTPVRLAGDHWKAKDSIDIASAYLNCVKRFPARFSDFSRMKIEAMTDAVQRWPDGWEGNIMCAPQEITEREVGERQ